jgi:hypothetical protein
MNGLIYLNNTQPHTGHFFCFIPVEDTVFAEFELAGGTIGGNAFVGDVMPAGIPIYAQFTSITLASGRGWAYKAVKEAS